MGDVSRRIANLSPEQRALLERRLTKAAGPVARTSREPIAIVGMSCRFPGGVASPDAFWRLLRDGVDAISEVPRDRWDVDAVYDSNPETPGKICTRWGGFLERVQEFDAAFFGISPREAARMDPQQRLLLEAAWEAVEDAGQPAQRLAGRAAGVFVGIHSLSSDYYLRQAGSLRDLDVHTSTGVAHSIMANRLSYLLDLSGPSLAVDTACSSSLVAVHLACQSLRLGECELAVAGGVNVILSPEVTVALSKLNMMAADGRCKTFDARADGFVRSEGCGIVVLRRLADALADGDPIVAIIRGTAVNQDGATNGITAPSGLRQRAVVRSALENGGVEAGDVSYLETHGTGTALGDPIEVEALAATVGRGDAPCFLGAVKSNIGHLEGAAGIAGLIKAALCLRHRFVPPNLHFRTLNPHIDLAGTRFVIPTEGHPWTSPSGAARIAGVSSFGFGGTNAHIVLEEAPAATAAAEAPDRPLPLCFSARSPEALRQLSADYAAFLADPERGGPLRLLDVAHSAGVRRSHHSQRAAVVGASREEWIAALERFAARPVRVSCAEQRPGLVFVYSGQGSQWAGMGLELHRAEPVFRASLERADAEVRRLAGWSLLDALRAPEAEARVRRTDVAQPAIFAIQAALTDLLRSWGVEPEALLGHSAGEVAAAHAAGVLSFEEAMSVAVERGRLMQAAAGRGEMAALELTTAQAEQVLAAYGGRLEVASVNSPTSTVISGEPASLEALLEDLEARGTYCKRLDLGFAFHSRQMEPFRAGLIHALRTLRPARPRLPLFSTVSGRRAEEGDYGASYWARGIRERVRFAEAVAACAREGRGTYLEIGPHPVLGPMIRRCGLAAERDLVPLASLRRREGEVGAMLEALCGLYRLGHPVDWSRCLPPGGRAVRLPTYPWQRERHWMEESDTGGRRHAGPDLRVHPLLGRRIDSALKEVLFEAAIGPQSLPFLGDHRIYGNVVFPAAAYLEMALAAATAAFGPGHRVIEDLVISEALLLSPGEDRVVQVIVAPDVSGAAPIQIFGREDGVEGRPHRWRLHAMGRTSEASPGPASPPESLAAVRARCAHEVAVEPHYEALRDAGIEFGPCFRGIARLWRGEGEAVGRIRLPQALDAADRYHIHPALLDACVQVLGAAVGNGSRKVNGNGRSFEHPLLLPVSLTRFRIHARCESEVWSYVRIREGEGDGRPTVVGDLRLFDEAGHLVAELEGLTLARATPEALRRVTEPPAGQEFYEVAWRPQPLARRAEAGPLARRRQWLVFVDADGLGEELARRWREQGDRVVTVIAGSKYDVLPEDRVQIDPGCPGDFRRLLSDATGDGTLAGAVHLWSLSAPEGGAGDALRRAVAFGCGSLLDIVHALGEVRGGERPRLWVVTRGAQAVDRTPGVALAQAPVWGLARTIAAEHPELRCACVDLDPATGADACELLASEIGADERDDQVGYRQARRHVARLVRSAAPPVSGSQPVELGIATRGFLDELRLRPVSRRAPGGGEVEIRVSAAGLNFRDVLNALGVYEGPAGPMGGECAGHVVAVGEGVEGLEVGQAVVALSPGSFRTYLTTPAELVVAKPEALSLEEAASAPVAFLTAEYALDHLAHLRRGERVLIHAAAGGVGLAAVQVAQRAGAEVLATAGSPEKRAWLQSRGVRDVMDSRSLVFAEEVRARTAGQGVDVVLNSLAGEFIPRSLGVLRAGGRFLEIGRKGIWTAEQVAAVRPDLSYFPIYLGEVEPALLRPMLVRLMDHLASGALKALPVRPFPMTEASSAFRYMAQARHIGKIVLNAEPPGRVWFRGDATYLVTGGLGSLGLLVGRWLVQRGARHLVLAGRRGLTPPAARAVADMERAGAHVVVSPTDVAREEDVSRLVAEIAATMPALRGVVHAAGVLDDGVVMQQSWERFEHVLGPKAWGAWNLHRATRGIDLDFYVLFSSAAALMGSPGQSNYAAANAFLDALAHLRRGEGLPALSINWGPWAEVGMAASLDRRDRARWTRQGLRLLSPEEGMAALERAFGSGSPQVCVLPLDVRKFLAPFAPGAESPLLAELAAGRSAERGEGTSSARPELVAQLEDAPPSRRRAVIFAHVRAQVVSVLGLDIGSAPGPQQGLRDVGLDSLMAIELRNRLQRTTGQSLPPTLAFDFPTVQAIVEHLALEVFHLGPPARARKGAAKQSAGAELEGLSEQEAEALLLEELQANRQEISE